MSEKLAIGDLTVAKGELKFGSLGSVELGDSTEVKIPLIVLRGVEEGPKLLVTSAIHGNEMVGAEVIRKLVWENLDPKKVKGTFIALPVANPLAIHFGTRNTPQDEVNLNRVFPGNSGGSITHKMAHIIWNKAIEKTDYHIDIHGNNPPCTAFTLLQQTEDEEATRGAVKIAKAFGLTTVYKHKSKAKISGMAMQTAMGKGIPSITVELIDPRRLTKDSVSIGVKGILNVMKAIGMIRGEFDGQSSEFIYGNGWVEDGTKLITNRGGIMVPEKEPGKLIREGEIVARIYNPYGEELEKIVMPEDGYIRQFSIGTHQVQNAGDAVVSITKTK